MGTPNVEIACLISSLLPPKFRLRIYTDARKVFRLYANFAKYFWQHLEVIIVRKNNSSGRSKWFDSFFTSWQKIKVNGEWFHRFHGRSKLELVVFVYIWWVLTYIMIIFLRITLIQRLLIQSALLAKSIRLDLGHERPVVRLLLKFIYR